MSTFNSRCPPVSYRKQGGVVLFLALIAVVLLLIAGLATLRAVDTTTLITGNLAFREGALQSSDTGVEFARGWLVQQTVPSGFYENLTYDIEGQVCPGTAVSQPGYFPIWDNSFDPKSEVFSSLRRCPPGGGGAAAPVSWSTDSIVVGSAPAGYTVQYVIHRLCERVGDYSNPALRTNCYVADAAGSSGSSQGSASYGGSLGSTTTSGSPYYRVTVRVTGPRKSTAFVQALVY